MEPALKQRLIGASVLVALAVIFLPMLIKGPAPESGASDVPLDLPPEPRQDQFETRELPLVTPGEAPQGGAVGMQAGGDADALPTVDTAAASPEAPAANAMMPAPTAGGDYAVSFGSYATAADAQRVVEALLAAQLPGYQETVSGASGRTLHRVRIGPYATRAEAETARLNSARVRGDVGAKVVTLDADAAPAPTDASQSAAAAATPTVSRPEPLPENKPVVSASKPAAETPKPTPTPARTAPATPAAKPATPAASNVGFAVQLGAFSNAADAAKLRDQARAAGFSAFVERVETDKGALNRVRVGPVATRADADRLKAQVAGKLGVGGIVRPHP